MRKKKRIAGGSATIERRGLKRGGGEVNPGEPSRFCVVDGQNEGDLSEADLRARYKGNIWAQAVIGAALDLYRAAEAAPEFFWHRLRDGVNDPIRYVDLGEDRKGVTWLLVVDGRHRKDGILKVNAERVGTSDPEPLDLPSLAVKLPQGDANAARAAEIVRRIKTDANIHVPMAPSHIAARAIEWHLKGHSDFVVGQKIGLRLERCEQDVPCFLALAQCCQEIRDAVDAGEVPMATIGRWRNAKGDLTKTPAEQRDWLTAFRTPKTRAARGEGTPRPLPPRRVVLLAAALPDGPLAELAALLRGQLKPEAITDPALKKAWEASS